MNVEYIYNINKCAHTASKVYYIVTHSERVCSECEE